MTIDEYIKQHPPVPVLGQQAYDKVKEGRRMNYPETDINYYRCLNQQWPYLPIRADIENVSRCNFACVMCPISERLIQGKKAGKRALDMKYDEYVDWLNRNYGLLEIKMQGIGEPTLQFEFHKFLMASINKGMWTRTITNASLFHLQRTISGHKKTVAERLIESGVHEVQISIDGCTPNVFSSIRRGSYPEQVFRNALEFNRMEALNQRRTAKMWVVVQAGNIHQLFEFIPLANRLCFTSVAFGLDVNTWGVGGNEHRDRYEMIPLESLEALVDQGYTHGIRVGFKKIMGEYTKEHMCPWPFNAIYMGSDMKTSPCCIIGDPDVYSYGEWGSAKHREFIDAHLTDNLPDICKACYKR